VKSVKKKLPMLAYKTRKQNKNDFFLWGFIAVVLLLQTEKQLHQQKRGK
jgi:hypothetical protein